MTTSLLNASIDSSLFARFKDRIPAGQRSQWIEDRIRLELGSKEENKNITKEEKIIQQEGIILEQSKQIKYLKEQLIESQKKLRKLNEELIVGRAKYNRLRGRI